MSWWQGINYKYLEGEPVYCRVCGKQLMGIAEPIRYDGKMGTPRRWRITVQCEVYGQAWFKDPQERCKHDRWEWETGSADEARAYASRGQKTA